MDEVSATMQGKRRFQQYCIAICLASSLLWMTRPSEAQVNPCGNSQKSKTDASAVEQVIRDALAEKDQTPIIFNNTIIHGKLDFSSFEANADGRVHINVPLTFQDVDFENEVTASRPGKTAYFDQPVVIDKGNFCGATSFADATFFRNANFASLDFWEDAEWNDTTFALSTVFADVRFHSNVRMQRLISLSSLSFNNIEYFYDAFFGGLEAKNLAFVVSTFHRTASFETVKIEDKTIFSQITLMPDTKLNFFKAQLSNFELEFANPNAKIEPFIILDQAAYDSLHVPHLNVNTINSISSSTQSLIDTLRKLEDALRAQGQLGIANDAFYRRSVLEREEKTFFSQALEKVLLDIPFGYGVYPDRALLVSAALIALFAIFYVPERVVPLVITKTRPTDEKPTALVQLNSLPIVQGWIPTPRHTQSKAYIGLREFFDRQIGDRFKTRKINTPSKTRFTDNVLEFITFMCRDYFIALQFSFSVFTKIRLQHRATTRGIIVTIEWFIGLLMIVGFIYSLTNTIPILSNLLRTIIKF